MLSLAMSMILYGVLVKTETLGSTDGFHVEAGSFLGWRPQGATRNLALFWLVLAFSRASRRWLVARYFRSVAGSLAHPIRDNEIRVEFLGISVDRLIHLKLVVVRHSGRHRRRARRARRPARRPADGVLDHVGRLRVRHHPGRRGLGRRRVRRLAAVRSWCAPSPSTSLPGAWQMILGTALLLTILFLPEGLGSLVTRLRRRRKAAP